MEELKYKDDYIHTVHSLNKYYFEYLLLSISSLVGGKLGKYHVLEYKWRKYIKEDYVINCVKGCCSISRVDSLNLSLNKVVSA